MFQKIAIIGIGLMGGSFAAACLKQLPQTKVMAYDTHPDSLKFALENNLIHQSLSCVAEAAQADLIILATPLGSFAALLGELQPHLQDKTLISDLGSVKSSVVELAAQVLSEKTSQFIPGHPLAGSEKNTIHAANANLFTGKKIILTPTAENDRQDVIKLQTLWTKLNADVIIMDVAEHDKILASTSHLPHVISYAYLSSIFSQQSSQQIKKLSAGSFADLSRIAKSNPTIWKDIFKHNQKNLLDQITIFEKSLTELKDLLIQDDAEGIVSYISQIRKKLGDKP